MKKQKIGFVVEGSLDKVVVEALAPRIAGVPDKPHVVRIGGAIAVRWAYSTVLRLLEDKGCEHVILVLDADASLASQVEKRQQEIEAMLEEHRLGSDEVSVCLAVPEIEAWLLAAYDEHPDASPNPKAALSEHLGVPQVTDARCAELAQALDIEKARARSSSFDKFVRTLRRIVERSSQAPAA